MAMHPEVAIFLRQLSILKTELRSKIRQIESTPKGEKFHWELCSTRDQIEREIAMYRRAIKRNRKAQVA